MNPASHFSVLVVDDEPDLRTLYELALLREGYDVESAGTVEDGWSLLQERPYHVLITDMRLPDGNGLDLLRRIDDAGRTERVIVITAYGSPENAVQALKAGAFDYLTKPVDLRQFRNVVRSALGQLDPEPAAGAAAAPEASRPGAEAVGPAPTLPAAARRAARGAQPAAASATTRRMAGNSQAMQQVRELVDKVARSMAPVLIQGESGTGKELVARSIHQQGSRANRPFIAVNCGAIPEQLLEAEFFGYRKGAFTGAQEDREGFFQAAAGGTLFLDEIGDLPLSMQSKLLRVIQERAVRAVGAVQEVPVDVRIVSASHKDLGQEVQAARFRQDLYYRLNVIGIRVPPLRERVDDLPALCATLLERIALESGLPRTPRLTQDALAQLVTHSFPGNVRELENLLHRAVALSGSAASSDPVIHADDLGLATQTNPLYDAVERVAASGASAEGVPPAGLPLAQKAARTGGSGGKSGNSDLHSAAARPDAEPPKAADLPSDLGEHLDHLERDILIKALQVHRYNRTAAGASLGLTLRQMRYRMARLGIQEGAEVGGSASTDSLSDPA